jgi:Mg-chelatase subunit ChlD
LTKALASLTGERLGDTLHLWKRWWRDHGYRFKVPETPPEPKAGRKDTGERRSAATFFGLPVRETHVVFVIDQSTSMSKQPGRGGLTRLDIAKRELLAACAQLPKGARINVVFFHREVWQWKRTMITVTPGTRKQLERDLDKLVPIGITALYDGLETALAEEEVRAIYLLSDGEPHGGRFDDPEEILREVAIRNQLRRAVIHCISIERKSELLQRLAAAHGGRYTER